MKQNNNKNNNIGYPLAYYIFRLLLILFLIIIVIPNAFKLIRYGIWQLEKGYAQSHISELLECNDIEVKTDIRLSEGTEDIWSPVTYYLFPQKDVKINIYLETETAESADISRIIDARNKITDYIEGTMLPIFSDKDSLGMNIMICFEPKSKDESRIVAYADFSHKPLHETNSLKEPHRLFNSASVHTRNIRVSDMKEFTDAAVINLNTDSPDAPENLKTDHDFSCFPDLKYLSISGLDDDPELEEQIRATLPEGCKLYSHGKYS